MFFFFFSSRRRHTIWNCDWSSDVCSSDLSHGQLRFAGGNGESAEQRHTGDPPGERTRGSWLRENRPVPAPKLRAPEGRFQSVIGGARASGVPTSPDVPSFSNRCILSVLPAHPILAAVAYAACHAQSVSHSCHLPSQLAP